VNWHIRLRGVSGTIDGKVWESDSRLRTGRLGTLEIVLYDMSVSRLHAEIRLTPQGWHVRDLGSTNGTYVNGTRLGPEDWLLRSNDIIRCGNATLVVDLIRDR
jgi:pSer/pThr/pTyr-binding forkhead associated (FHA) protein